MPDPWDVVSQTPISNQQPPAGGNGGGGGDPWAVVSQTPTGPQSSAWSRFKQWAHSEGTDSTGSDVLDSIRDFGQGAGASAAEVPATIGGLADKIIAKAKGQANYEDPLTAAFKRASGTAPDNLSAKAGSMFENVAEWMVGEEALRGLTMGDRMTKLAPVVKMLEKYPKIAEAAAAHPEIMKLLPEASRQALIGTVQAGAHGEGLPESLESGAIAGSLGLALPMVSGALKGSAANIAEKVAPEVRDIEGVKFTQLASEARGPSGELTAPKIAQKAAQYGAEPALRAERQQAFKQLETNLAKKGVRGALEDTNAAVSKSGAGGNIQATTPGGDFRYIPPDGSTSLTGPEAKSAMDEIEQQWLDRDTTPEQDKAYSQAYSDIKNQLNRQEAYTTNAYKTAQPYQLHDAEQAASGVNSWRDAANQMDSVASAKMKQLGLSQEYQQLTAARDEAQSEFNKALRNPDLENHIAAQQKLQATSDALEDFVREKGTQPDVPKSIAQRALVEQRTANGFRALQNMMDIHMNLHADTAEAINRPRVTRKLGSLSDHVEAIKSKYGDVLNPVLGDQGLNHITELGDLLNQPKAAKVAPKTFMENLARVIQKHFAGGRGVIAGTGGATLYLAHGLAHAAGGGAAGLGVLGSEAFYRMMVNRMATDPAFSEKIITAAKSGANPRRLAGTVGAAMGLERRKAEGEQREQQTIQEMRREAGLE